MLEEKQTLSLGEEKKSTDNSIIKILKLASKSGLIGLGGFLFLYGMVQYFSETSFVALQATYFLQAELGLLIIGIGILIKEVKKNQK